MVRNIIIYDTNTSNIPISLYECALQTSYSVVSTPNKLCIQHELVGGSCTPYEVFKAGHFCTSNVVCNAHFILLQCESVRYILEISLNHHYKNLYCKCSHVVVNIKKMCVFFKNMIQCHLKLYMWCI